MVNESQSNVDSRRSDLTEESGPAIDVVQSPNHAVSSHQQSPGRKVGERSAQENQVYRGGAVHSSGKSDTLKTPVPDRGADDRE